MTVRRKEIKQALTIVKLCEKVGKRLDKVEIYLPDESTIILHLLAGT